MVEIDEEIFRIEKYNVDLNSVTELGLAAEIILNGFKSIFREELSNALTDKFAQAL